MSSKITNKILLISTVIFIIGAVSLSPIFVSAAVGYESLVQLPQVQGHSTVGLTSYLNTLFYLTIGVASVLAILMIVIGGIQYMSTEAVSGKGDAKDKLWNAVKGLLLIVFAWLLLNTINPDLLKTELDIDKANIVAGEKVEDYKLYTVVFSYTRYELEYIKNLYVLSYLNDAGTLITRTYETLNAFANLQNILDGNDITSSVRRVTQKNSSGEEWRRKQTFPGTKRGEELCNDWVNNAGDSIIPRINCMKRDSGDGFDYRPFTSLERCEAHVKFLKENTVHVEIHGTPCDPNNPATTAGGLIQEGHTEQ
ncbi:hypothetical protein COB55_05040 [Candidatus Wolfebacteria bacterium]|nr:MAG: hypothetical protein COB55_05040 [Candidatus Wolfebacteria bacterium]